MAFKKPPKNHTDIGRSTIYGNPVKIGIKCSVCFTYHNEAGSTLHCFERYARERLEWDIEYRDKILSLKDKVLWCPGCGVGSPTCHGRILEKLLMELNYAL